MGIILFNLTLISFRTSLPKTSSFRPLMGIILFNNIPEDLSIVDLEYLAFPSPNGDYFI